MLAEKCNFQDEMARRNYALQCLRLCAGLKNSLDKEDMLKEIQVKTGYSLEVLQRQLSNLNSDQLEKANVRKAKGKKPDSSVESTAERMLLKLGLNGYDGMIRDKLTAEDFLDEYHKEVFCRLGDMDQDALLAEAKDEETAGKAARILSAVDRLAEQEQAVLDCVAILKKRRIKTEIDQKKAELASAGEQDRKRLLSEISSLQIKWKEL